jgi:hypothetical protein
MLCLLLYTLFSEISCDLFKNKDNMKYQVQHSPLSIPLRDACMSIGRHAVLSVQ